MLLRLICQKDGPDLHIYLLLSPGGKRFQEQLTKHQFLFHVIRKEEKKNSIALWESNREGKKELVPVTNSKVKSLVLAIIEGIFKTQRTQWRVQSNSNPISVPTSRLQPCPRRIAYLIIRQTFRNRNIIIAPWIREKRWLKFQIKVWWKHKRAYPAHSRLTRYLFHSRQR